MTTPCAPFQLPLTPSGTCTRTGAAGQTRLRYRQHYRPATFRLPEWMRRVWLWC
jgi:hypothetical protein